MESLVDGNGGGSRRVMTELSHIQELVKQLDVQLGGCPDLCKHLAAQIVTVTEKSIGMIMSGHFHGPKRSATDAGIDSPAFPATPSPTGGVSGMPKKRKMMEKGDRRVRVSSAAGGADAREDDGFSWRKYGQKEILGAQHPRAYYRCTHRKTQGCAAIKQVQRADEDPTLYDVTYHGTHTCLHKTAAAAKVQPATPNPDAGSLLRSLSSSLTVNTEGLTPGPQQSTPFSFSSPSVSGLTAPPEHYTFSTPSMSENCFGQGVSLSPSLPELSPATSDWSYIPFEEDSSIVSALVSGTSIPETAFSLDELFDPNFDVSFFLAEM
ncbi:transcription factor WRKY19-like [Lolium rigidum]|uniref:transcription factor WRKY19-like n=1 Tax=Lolium rigidum TaxID=89674 RepID=UPI001F5DE7FC|nr:transcription factor WRKY19-like [Lolium rigidum]XP_051228752.1 transcription factor WRKY19-like [Lolium perenne]